MVLNLQVARNKLGKVNNDFGKVTMHQKSTDSEWFYFSSNKKLQVLPKGRYSIRYSIREYVLVGKCRKSIRKSKTLIDYNNVDVFTTLS